jgi:hypothetical protein
MEIFMAGCKILIFLLVIFFANFSSAFCPDDGYRVPDYVRELHRCNRYDPEPYVDCQKCKNYFIDPNALISHVALGGNVSCYLAMSSRSMGGVFSFNSENDEYRLAFFEAREFNHRPSINNFNLTKTKAGKFKIWIKENKNFFYLTVNPAKSPEAIFATSEYIIKNCLVDEFELYKKEEDSYCIKNSGDTPTFLKGCRFVTWGSPLLYFARDQGPAEFLPSEEPSVFIFNKKALAEIKRDKKQD